MIFLFFFFSSFCLRLDADRHSAVLKIGVNHATCYVFRQKLLRHKYTRTMLCICTLFFFVLFIFIHVRFEGNNKYAKKVLSQPWNSLTLHILLSLREKHDKIVFTLQGYFGRSDNLLRSPHIFVILDKRSELSGCFLFKRLQRSEGILIIFELIPSKELVFRVERPTPPLGRTKDNRESRDLRCLFAKSF